MKSFTFLAMPLRRAAIFALVVMPVSLTSCASIVETFSRRQDSAILNAHSVQGRRSGWRDIHPDQEAADDLRGAANKRKSAIAKSEPDLAVSAQIQTDGYAPGSFFALQADAQANPQELAKQQKYIAAGLALSNELCDAWFGDIGRARTTLHETSDLVSQLGTLSITMLDLTRAKRPSPGFTATLFGLGKSSIDNLDANYIVMADISTVKEAVKRYRGKYALEIENAPSANWNYYTARRVIMAYDNTCSALTVHEFIKVKIEGGSATDKLAAAQMDLMKNLATATAPMFADGANVTPDTLVDLYTYLYTFNAGTDAVKSRVLSNLGDNRMYDSANNRLKLANVMGDDGNFDPEKYSAALSELKSKFDNSGLSGELYNRALAGAATTNSAANAQSLMETEQKESLDKFISAPTASADQPGWHDFFAVDGSADLMTQAWLQSSEAFTNATIAVQKKLRSNLDPSIYASGKYAFLNGKSIADFKTAINNPAYPGLKAILETSATAVVKRETGAQKGSASSVDGVISPSGTRGSTNSWAMPVAPSGRSLDVPPPIEGTD